MAVVILSSQADSVYFNPKRCLSRKAFVVIARFHRARGFGNGFSVRHRWTEVGAILPCCTQSQLVDGAMVFGLKVHVIYAVAEGESGTLSILNCMQSDWSEHDRFTDVESRAPVLSWRLKPRSRVVCRDLLTIASTLFFCLGLLALPGRKPTRKLPNPTSQQRLGRSSTR